MSAKFSDRKLELLDREISRLNQLLTDLTSMRDGSGPNQDFLECCPLIDFWSVGTRPVRCLTGIFINHPKIDQGSFGMTSELVWLDKERGFARTRSRFYRLASPA